ncbi:SSU ribosomal protein S12P methylthiotransferase [Thermanaeromonas toyohensis ToBE]|uniref:Ribosomal protein uS12 methylthiotransferase RimO n=1 Tax=Thermanaeromonas toyohensis ToBE TaxID=698762 RepID=A0A1W1VVP2_9FIRM|nr:30S ribosomal protein S12 methylthiotransferase RimO [Thermanaeromonas toyohensis]SMB97171.1 SSU ribosomal protein S12P methylthiotransferase [Thermanaeromonas toyohensis ToBE]
MAKVALLTLGCAKNQVDSEYMMGVLEESDHELVDSLDKAEVVIVNTCSFITPAKEEALEVILEVAQARKGLYPYIIVAGCLAQQHARELFSELPEVSAFIGPGAIPRLAHIIGEVLRGKRVLDVPLAGEENYRGLPRTRLRIGPTAYLKIAEGCNNKCSYCTIPQIKGPYRSRPLEDLLTEARFLISRGAQELVLVAQDTTAYGLDLYGSLALPVLLRELAHLPGVKWLRLLYAYPTRITPELIEVMAEEDKICRYLDLPLQHAHPEILQAMGRPGTLEAARKALSRLKATLPEIALRSTFIVGFPGERETHFRELLNFLEEIRFDWVGAFIFSPEEGTPASRLPGQVPEEIKKARYERLLSHQQHITEEKNLAWVGRETEVLIEGRASLEEGEVLVGRSFRQAPEVDGVIYLKVEKSLGVRPGELVKAKLLAVKNIYDLWGQVLF